jgi:hypothetical protein
VGIAELPGVSSLLVFPNPVQDQLTLRLDAQTASAYEVSIWDATGSMIAAPVNWNVQGLSLRSLNTAALAAGSYTIRISSADHAAHIPFIKQ